ncbi:hypothetical protein AMTRI_Chr08g166510 [Amborella trichopoda]|uniref:Uncharacterized protein n=1 Tax=Amborella trichopoda TaxID=13333 RepID=W1PC85_AMBTC|nr:hypothetical protein AMTR_s00007p00039540 [Amborella trichopoda]
MAAMPPDSGQVTLSSEAHSFAIHGQIMMLILLILFSLFIFSLLLRLYLKLARREGSQDSRNPAGDDFPSTISGNSSVAGSRDKPEGDKGFSIVKWVSPGKVFRTVFPGEKTENGTAPPPRPPDQPIVVDVDRS